MSRLDVWLFENGFATTRSKAQDFIERGLVKINDEVVTKTGYKVKNTDKIEVEKDHYVARSAHKLVKALDHYQILVKDKICLDVGASTGGFTQVLLERGAKKVYALDVGHGQLANIIKENPKVINIEGTNIKDVESLPDKIELIVVDVSFISIIKIIPHLKKFSADMVVLIKPQFEAGPKNLKDGIIKSEDVLKNVIQEVKENLTSLNIFYEDFINSPILGKDGNKEFLTYLKIKT